MKMRSHSMTRPPLPATHSVVEATKIKRERGRERDVLKDDRTGGAQEAGKDFVNCDRFLTPWGLPMTVQLPIK